MNRSGTRSTVRPWRWSSATVAVPIAAMRNDGAGRGSGSCEQNLDTALAEVNTTHS